MPGELKEAIRAFIEYYNYRRYHEGLGNLHLTTFTPAGIWKLSGEERRLKARH
jgi:transposase InsO family protein